MNIQHSFNFVEDTELCRIMQEAGSDAAGPYHNYTKLYSTIFEPVRNAPLRILEIGLEPNPDISGSTFAEGVRGWRRYFPNATIVGVDPSAEWIVPVEGVSTYAYDWNDPSGITSIFDHEDTREPFDILIYDGPGNPADKAIYFQVFAEHVREGGVIIVEDIDWKESVFWMSVKQQWDKAYPHFSWRPISIPFKNHKGDNILMIAQAHANADAAKASMPVPAAPAAAATNEVICE